MPESTINSYLSEATRHDDVSLTREDAKCISIITMTANAFSDDTKASEDAGMNAHLAKPIDVHKMYQTILDVLQ